MTNDTSISHATSSHPTGSRPTSTRPTSSRPTSTGSQPIGADADDPRPAFDRAARLAVSVVERVRPDQMEAATPCGDMDVRRLGRHLHMALGRAEAVAAGLELPDDDDSIADADLAAAVAEAADEACRRWRDDELLSREMELPWMTAPGRVVLGIYLNEAIVHTWDLATATGQTVAWDDADVELSLALIRGQLPVADRDELWAMYRRELPDVVTDDWEAPFSNAVEVDDDAPAIDRLVAWCGRTP